MSNENSFKDSMYFAVILILFFGVIFMGATLLLESKTEAECKRMLSYGYDARLSGNDWVGWDCYIQMEDGTMVHSKDFNIADYKKPLSTNNVGSVKKE